MVQLCKVSVRASAALHGGSATAAASKSRSTLPPQPIANLSRKAHRKASPHASDQPRPTATCHHGKLHVLHGLGPMAVSRCLESVAYPLGCVGGAGGNPGAERASFADALLQDLAIRRLAQPTLSSIFAHIR